MSLSEPRQDGNETTDDIAIDQEPGATHPIRTALETLVNEMRGLRQVVPLLSNTAKAAEEEARDRKQDAYSQLEQRPYDDEPVKSIPERRRLTAGMRTTVLHPSTDATGFLHAERDLGSAVLMMMGAHFDRFIGEMMQAAFEIKPELRKSLRREIAFVELDQLPNLEAVHNLVIEKEIEDCLHRSRDEQIKWFESRCGMPTFDQDLSGDLADVAGLRNLIAHHGGRVTNKVSFGMRRQRQRFLSQYEVGESVFVNEQDIDAVHDILVAAAVSISQNTWRNLRKDQMQSADVVFHELTYTCLALEEFKLAQRLLLLGFKFRKSMSLNWRLVSTVNLAQAFKWLGDHAGCHNVLGSENWDLHDLPYRLSVSVLNENWEEAKVLMRRCIEEDLVDRAEFEDWPVFREFRKTEQFQEVFTELYSV